MAERPAAEWLYPCSASVKALEEDFTAMLASSSSECDTPLGDATAACVPGVGQLGTSEKSIARERMDSLECFVQGTEIYNRRQTRVIQCFTKLGRSPLVLKVSAESGMSVRQKLLIEREIRLCKQLSCHRHPGVVHCYETFEDSENFYQVLEYCSGGDLYAALHSTEDPFSEAEVAATVMPQLLESLAFLHRQGIVHRDVKLENLLLSGDKVKLADFGLAINLDERPRSPVGTVDYNAPEVSSQPSATELAGAATLGPPYDEKVDVWAAGVVAYELLIGQPPFYLPDAEDTRNLIQGGTLPGFLGFLSQDCVDFLRLALRKDPKERPSAEELLMHPWLAFHAAKRPHEAPAKLSDAAKAGGSNAWLQRRPGSAVATFASPNASLSPRLGSWKINTLPDSPTTEPRTPEMTAADSPALQWNRPASASLEDTAEDIGPRDEEIMYAEFSKAVPSEPRIAITASTAPVWAAPPPYLAPLRLRRLQSAGKSRLKESSSQRDPPNF